MRLGRDSHSATAWKPLEKYLDSETVLIPVSDIEGLSKKRFSEVF
jgi:hypothetical protein